MLLSLIFIFHINIVYECIVLRCIVENKPTYLLTYLLTKSNTALRCLSTINTNHVPLLNEARCTSDFLSRGSPTRFESHLLAFHFEADIFVLSTMPQFFQLHKRVPGWYNVCNMWENIIVQQLHHGWMLSDRNRAGVGMNGSEWMEEWWQPEKDSRWMSEWVNMSCGWDI